jgi:hypothetical protein
MIEDGFLPRTTLVMNIRLHLFTLLYIILQKSQATGEPDNQLETRERIGSGNWACVVRSPSLPLYIT